jgi:hypothetical protein
MSNESMKVATVTEERKHELLMEARRARLDWVKSSTPYKHSSRTNNNNNHHDHVPSSNDGATKTDPLDVLKDATIVKHIPSTIQVLNCLIQSKEKLPMEKWKEKIDSQQNAIQSRNVINVLDDHAFIFYYQEIIERLCMPESMDLVQGMRRFVRSFNDLVNQPEPNLDKIVHSIQKYLMSIYDAIASHSSWRGDDNTETKMMIETFIYSKCHDMIWNVLVMKQDKSPKDGQLSFSERLDFLQFVRPEHLEIHCVGSDQQSSDFWRDALSRPIALLKSLDYLYSPSQMLRCILELYRAVNHSLKAAVDAMDMDRLVETDGEALPMMPSADDLLPTLILTMIYSQTTTNIPIHLEFIELFATQEQLRGEAGYAFTNLLSAVHFIKEIDFGQDDEDDDAESGKPTLQISPAELKQRLFDFQQQQQQQKQQAMVQSVENKDNKGKHGGMNDQVTQRCANGKDVRIPVSELVAARRRREDITEWARKYIHDLNSTTSSSSSSPPSSDLDQAASYGEETGQSTREIEPLSTTKAVAVVPPPPPLPEGFKRSYRFLATEPDDIRMSDVPSLLEEYRILVRATESLLAERQSILTKQHEFMMKTKKDVLKEALLEASKNVGHETNHDTLTDDS